MGKARSVRRSLLLRYGAAVVAVALVVVLKLVLNPLITQQSPFLLMAGAVMVGAWFGGFGPGVLATLLGALAADYFFLEPVGSFTGLGVGILPFTLFVLQGLLISFLVEALHSSRQRAEESMVESQSHQESLRRSEELYRSVVEQAEENIFLVDTETKRILQVNAAFHRSLGYAPEELKEMTLYDLVAHDRESVDRNAQRIVREGRLSLGERKYRRKDGSLAEMEVNASAISYGGREVLCIVAHDVTQRKRAEAELRRSLDSLLALYEAGHVLGSTLEREQIGSKLLEITQRVSDLTGACIDLLDEDQQLCTMRSIGPEELWRQGRSAPEADAARRAALEAGEPRSFELQRSDANRTRLMGLCLPLRVRDRVVGLLEAY